MNRSALAAMAAAMAWSCPTFAQDAELVKIREEIRQLKESYEKRIEALERKLTESERAATRASAASAVPTEDPRPARVAASNLSTGIGLVLQGTYSHTSQDPESYAITGFMPSGGEVGPPRRSFGLAETELIFGATIDPYFRGMAVAALTPDNEVEVEEAYIQTLALPRGFTLKAGRFFSGVGYQNEIHQHAWDFQDAPLPYRAFLAGRLKHDGVQLRWLAPTSLFLELGAEVSNGNSFPGSERNKNGIGGGSIFGHIGGDIGASYAWRAGLSHVRASPRGRSYDDVDALGGAVSNSFSGRAKVWIADAVLKWAPDGNPTRTNFKLQGEYFRFRQKGQLTFDDTAGSATFGSLTDDFRSRQSGWYLQAVWQFMPRWRIGARYDRLRHGNVENAIVTSGVGPADADFPLLASHDPTRKSVMIDWSPTEFSRLRLQFAADRSRFGTGTDRQWLLQYIHSLGAHGAHRF